MTLDELRNVADSENMQLQLFLRTAEHREDRGDYDGADAALRVALACEKRLRALDYELAAWTADVDPAIA